MMPPYFFDGHSAATSAAVANMATSARAGLAAAYSEKSASVNDCFVPREIDNLAKAAILEQKPIMEK